MFAGISWETFPGELYTGVFGLAGILLTGLVAQWVKQSGDDARDIHGNSVGVDTHGVAEQTAANVEAWRTMANELTKTVAELKVTQIQQGEDIAQLKADKAEADSTIVTLTNKIDRMLKYMKTLIMELGKHTDDIPPGDEDFGL